MTVWNSGRLGSHSVPGDYSEAKQFVGVEAGLLEGDGYQPEGVEQYDHGQDRFPNPIESRALIKQRDGERPEYQEEQQQNDDRMMIPLNFGRRLAQVIVLFQ